DGRGALSRTSHARDREDRYARGWCRGDCRLEADYSEEPRPASVRQSLRHAGSFLTVPREERRWRRGPRANRDRVPERGGNEILPSPATRLPDRVQSGAWCRPETGRHERAKSRGLAL